jgi:hypothetical protein
MNKQDESGAGRTHQKYIWDNEKKQGSKEILLSSPHETSSAFKWDEKKKDEEIRRKRELRKEIALKKRTDEMRNDGIFYKKKYEALTLTRRIKLHR